MAVFTPPDDRLAILARDDQYLINALRQLWDEVKTQAEAGGGTGPDFTEEIERLLSAPPVIPFEDVDHSETTIFVKTKSDLLGELSSENVYVPDGNIDMGNETIIVPPGGLTIEGFGFNTSSIFSSEDGHTLFETGSGSYSGDMFFNNLTVTASGSGARVFNVDNLGNNNAMEFNGVNWTDCTSLGILKNYRQMLTRNNAWINCDQGWTLEGSWAGFALIDSIMLLFNNPVGFKLLEAGAGFITTSSTRSNLNALQVPSDFVFYDWAPANVTLNRGVLLDGFRTAATNAVPNLPGSNVKAYYTNCLGIENTYVGGEYTVSAGATTTIAVIDTLVKMAGTTTYSEMDHFSNATDNAFVYDSNVPIDVLVSGILSFSGTANNEMAVQLRQWDASASAYINIGPEYLATLNGGPAGTRAENLGFQAYAALEKNDRIEVWVKNKTAALDITTAEGGSVAIRER